MFYFTIPFFIKSSNCLFTSKKNKNLSVFTLLDDEPIKSKVEDILGSERKAKSIYREIKNLNIGSSVAYGIVGKWGSGKTSYMNLVKQNFTEDNDFIVIDFNTWLNISIDSIVRDFFNTVEKEIKKYSFDLSKDIRHYGNSVLKIPKNKTSDVLLEAINFASDSSLTEDFEKTNKQLKKLNKRVVVFFDDIDRLQSNETFEILKLIRNTVSFDTFTYIVGYDKEYLIESLNKNQIPNPEKYCEKIFLKEFYLLPLTRTKINNFLSSNLLSIFEDKEPEIQAFFENVNISKGYYSENSFSLIVNLRDAKRFLNSFIVDYKEIKEEVEFKDYFYLKLLKFSFYEVYILLFTEKNRFVTSGKEDFIRNASKLTLNKEKAGFSYQGSFKDSFLQKYITENFEYSNEKLKKLELLLKNIFDNNDSGALSILFNNNYYKYFREEIDPNELSSADFNKFIKMDFMEQRKITEKWNREGKVMNLYFFIYQFNVLSIEEKEDFEKFIKILFHIANIKSDNDYSRIIGLDEKYLYNCLRNRHNNIVSKFYNDIDELRDFVKQILYEAKSPYEYEMQFCRSIYEESITDLEDKELILSKKDIEEYLIFCFEEFTSSMQKIENDFWRIIWGCQLTQWEMINNSNHYQSRKVFIPEVVNKFKEIVFPEHLDELLVHFTVPQNWYAEYPENKVGIASLPIELFESVDNLIEYLESEKINRSVIESNFLEEFLVFAKEVVKANSYISFEFKYPPVIEKLEKAKIRWR